MAYEIGTATDHYNLFTKFRTFVESTLPAGQRWTVLRADNSANREVIWKAPGYTGSEEIFLGMGTYQDVGLDLYNLYVCGMIGYVSTNTIDTQPGFSGRFGVPMWNQSINYWFVANAQRAVIVTKIQNVYTSCYIGKMFPFATPGQYPYPIYIGANIANASLIASNRYSDVGYSTWFTGNAQVMRFVDGVWKVPAHAPYYTTAQQRNTNADSSLAPGYYSLLPITLVNDLGLTGDVYGELEGCYFITGFDNSVENTVVINGITYVVIRDVWRTGFNSYMALRLQ